MRARVQIIALVVVRSLLNPMRREDLRVNGHHTISSSTVSTKSCRTAPDFTTPITPSALRTKQDFIGVERYALFHAGALDSLKSLVRKGASRRASQC